VKIPAKNVKVLIASAIVLIVFLTLIPKNATKINNAVVNEKNGDIAFSYMSSWRGESYVTVALYNREGEELFFRKFWSDGSAVHMAFEMNILYVYLDRNNAKYCFDRTGETVEGTEITIAELKKRHDFYEWERSFGEKTYVLDDCRYCYRAPIFFRDRAELVIEKKNKSFIIYESH